MSRLSPTALPCFYLSFFLPFYFFPLTCFLAYNLTGRHPMTSYGEEAGLLSLFRLLSLHLCRKRELCVCVWSCRICTTRKKTAAILDTELAFAISCAAEPDEPRRASSTIYDHHASPRVQFVHVGEGKKRGRVVLAAARGSTWMNVLLPPQDFILHFDSLNPARVSCLPSLS